MKNKLYHYLNLLKNSNFYKNRKNYIGLIIAIITTIYAIIKLINEIKLLKQIM
jgi:hypothetical protein